MGMEVAAAAAVVGAGAQAYGSVQAGRENYRGAMFEQEQLKIAAQQNLTAAAQAEAKRRDEMTSSLETIQALRAGRNTGAYSPTGRAIMQSAMEDAENDIDTERANYLAKADLNRRSAVMAGRKAKTSLLAGYLGAAEAGASAAFKFGNYAYQTEGIKRPINPAWKDPRRPGALY